jgi:hypothetical protein
MIGTEDLFVNCQRPLVQRFGIGVTTLLIVTESQIVQRFCDIGVIGTKHFFAYGQRVLEQRFGIGVATLV